MKAVGKEPEPVMRKVLPLLILNVLLDAPVMELVAINMPLVTVKLSAVASEEFSVHCPPAPVKFKILKAAVVAPVESTVSAPVEVKLTVEVPLLKTELLSHEPETLNVAVVVPVSVPFIVALSVVNVSVAPIVRVSPDSISIVGLVNEFEQPCARRTLELAECSMFSLSSQSYPPRLESVSD